jgi:hypothetical protein
MERRRSGFEVPRDGVMVDDDAEAGAVFERLNEKASGFEVGLKCEIPGTTNCLRYESSIVGSYNNMGREVSKDRRNRSGISDGRKIPRNSLYGTEGKSKSYPHRQTQQRQTYSRADHPLQCFSVYRWSGLER